MALAGIDMAVGDALARLEGRRWSRCSAARRSGFASTARSATTAQSRSAPPRRRGRARGFTGVKAKIGYPTLPRTSRSFARSARRRAPTPRSWSTTTRRRLSAFARLRVLDDEGLAWVESWAGWPGHRRRAARRRTGSKGRGPPGSVGPRSARSRPGAVALVRQVAHDLLEDRGPARVELDADGPPRSARDGRAEQRPADAGERVEDQLAGPAEELDQARHQPRRLVRAVDPPGRVPQLGRVGRGQQRLGEVEPLLAGQLVERVGGVRARAGRRS